MSYRPQTTRITFGEHRFKDSARYECSCGNKFKRTETDYWTENPYNDMWVAGNIEGLNKKCKTRIAERLSVQECPKCGQQVARKYSKHSSILVKPGKCPTCNCPACSKSRNN